MPAKIIDGKSIANSIMHSVAKKVAIIKNQGLSVPELAVILVGDDRASKIYVDKKKHACAQSGIISREYNFAATAHQTEIEELIKHLNTQQNINGILVQLPLSAHINTDTVMELINPAKDIDGFHPYNIGKLVQRKPLLRPCTPKGVMKLLEHTDEKIRGKKALVIGASSIVGRPMALELLIAGCTVTIAHRFTKNLDEEIANADILISAIGKPEFISGENIKPGAIVIDVGINRTANNKIVGDIVFETARQHASWITPVPGGVGPMTVASLLENTLQAARQQHNKLQLLDVQKTIEP